MQYKSTRGAAANLSSAEAIIKGIASDGGLFVPDSVPAVDLDFITGLVPLSYEERAARVLGLFLTDYTADEIKGCVERAYGGGKFDTERRAPTRVLEAGNLAILELWHGPTSAFKDMALQLLPQLMSTALKKTGEKDDVLILVATSGDTGKAALEGFCDVPQTKIMVFYPQGGVSHIQQLQMLTQAGSNVNVTAVTGNFDDAQSGVKAIFGDADIAARLAEQGVKLSSANSINWGRLVPQIVYYFSSYADLLAAGSIEAGQKINFCVPTGNFGDILAGYYAMRMGLPVNKLICASNANNVLTDFLRTGVYDRNRAFHKTITPSMDILISSNLERLLYHVTGDAARVAGWMQELAATGRYDVGADVLADIQKVFWADWVGDDDTRALIGRAFQNYHYVPDTHTAVAWEVAEHYRQATGDTATPLVVVSTASPYKFGVSVLPALGESVEGLDDFAILDRLQVVSGTPAPEGLSSLRHKEIRHKDVVAPADMPQAVLDFASRK